VIGEYPDLQVSAVPAAVAHVAAFDAVQAVQTLLRTEYPLGQVSPTVADEHVRVFAAQAVQTRALAKYPLLHVPTDETLPVELLMVQVKALAGQAIHVAFPPVGA